MPGSPVGLVTVGAYGGKTILSTSAAGPTYSGPTLTEGGGFTNWIVHLTGTFTGFSVAIYGTNDAAVITISNVLAPPYASGPYIVNAAYPAPGSAGGNWFLLPAPAEQSGTGSVVNPLTSTQQSMIFKGPLRAICAVATGTAQTGTVVVQGSCTP